MEELLKGKSKEEIGLEIQKREAELNSLKLKNVAVVAEKLIYGEKLTKEEHDFYRNNASAIQTLMTGERIKEAYEEKEEVKKEKRRENIEKLKNLPSLIIKKSKAGIEILGEGTSITGMPRAELNANYQPQEKITQEEKIKIEKVKLNAKEEVESFLKNFKLEDIAPEKFKDLDGAQKLKVVRDLERRIVDMVKEGGQTQYSQYLSTKGKINLNSKEAKIKDLESKVFQELLSTDEGKKRIAGDFELLTKVTADKEIALDKKGNPNIVYLGGEETKDWTDEQKKWAVHFNEIAGRFQSMPYEWGQETKRSMVGNFLLKDNKRIYENAKQQYEKAKEQILLIKTKNEKPGEVGKAMLEVKGIDSTVKWEQLINTHPEFQKALVAITESSGYKEYLKTGAKILNTISGKNLTNRGLMALGFGARWGTKALAGMATTSTAVAGTATFIGAPVIGGTIGWFRGKFQGKEKMEGREKDARYEKEKKIITGEMLREVKILRMELTEAEKTGNVKEIKELNKSIKGLEGKIKSNRELGSVSNIADLTQKLEKLISDVENAKDGEAKGKALAMLGSRIEHTKGKIELGQVNFGDAKSFLINNYNLNEILNKAVVLKESNVSEVNKDVEERIEEMLYWAGKQMEMQTDKAQEAFIKKQAVRGALMGAGFATFGYGVRWVGEQFGAWEWMSEHMPKIHLGKGIAEKIAEAKNNIATNRGKWLGEQLNLIEKFREQMSHIHLPAWLGHTDGQEVVDKVTADTSAVDSMDSIKSFENSVIRMGYSKDFAEALSKEATPETVNLNQPFHITHGKDFADALKGTSHATGNPVIEKPVVTAQDTPHTNVPGHKIITEEKLTKAVAPENAPTNTESLLHNVKAGDGVTQTLKAIKEEGKAPKWFTDAVGEHPTPKDWAQFAKDIGVYDSKNVADSLDISSTDHIGFDKAGNLVLERNGVEHVLAKPDGNGGFIKGDWKDTLGDEKFVHTMGKGTETTQAGEAGAKHVDPVKNLTDQDLKAQPQVDPTKTLTNNNLTAPPQVDPNTTLPDNSLKAPPQVPATKTLDNTLKAPAQVDPKTALQYKQSTGVDTKILEKTLPVIETPMTPEMIQQAKEAYTQQIGKVFSTSKAMEAWNFIKDSRTADVMMGLKEESVEGYKPLVHYLHELNRVTHLEPISGNPTLGIKAESNDEYIRRALAWATKHEKLGEINAEDITAPKTAEYINAETVKAMDADVEKIYNDDLAKVFNSKAEESWNKIAENPDPEFQEAIRKFGPGPNFEEYKATALKIPASEYIGDSDTHSAYRQQLSDYMQKLHKITGLEPGKQKIPSSSVFAKDGFTDGRERAEIYIKRALEWGEKNGRLDELKYENLMAPKFDDQLYDPSKLRNK